ncbi:hypothetical protein [Escherichia coli]
MEMKALCPDCHQPLPDA